MKRFCFVLLLVGMAGVVQAETTKAPPLDIRQPADKVSQQIVSVRKALADGKTYSEIDTTRKADVEAALSRISGRLTRADGGALSPNDQVETLNDQALVNQVLSQARDDSRMVCKRERTVGSNLMTSQCMTVAQRKRQEEAGRRQMGDWQTKGGLPTN